MDMAVESQFNSENLVMIPIYGSVLGINHDGYFSNTTPQENLQQIHLLHQNQGFQFLGTNIYQEASSVSNGGDHFASMAFPQSLATLLEKQRQETNWVLQLQNQRLKSMLQNESRQHQDILLQRYQSKMTSIMWRKDEELAIATKKTMELEQCLRDTEIENQKWQRKAKENEAKVSELNNTLTQVRDRAIDAESACDFSSNRRNSKNMNCKLCNGKRSCVVFLPCRHLCSCRSCDVSVEFCPVCESVKEASMEVYLV